MNKETREKIEKFEGLDFCEHEKVRMRCSLCMWDVPAYIRQKHEKNLKEKIRQEKLLTSSLDYRKV